MNRRHERRPGQGSAEQSRAKQSRARQGSGQGRAGHTGSGQILCLCQEELTLTSRARPPARAQRGHFSRRCHHCLGYPWQNLPSRLSRGRHRRRLISNYMSRTVSEEAGHPVGCRALPSGPSRKDGRSLGGFFPAGCGEARATSSRHHRRRPGVEPSLALGRRASLDVLVMLISISRGGGGGTPK